MKKALLALAVLFFANSIQSQEWTELMHQKDANLYTIQAAFNAYWDTANTSAKSRGYKAFKRWENYVGPRVYPTGNLSVLSENANNFNAFVQHVPTSQNTKNIGGPANIASTTWSVVGPMGAMTGSAVNGLPRKAGRDNFITFHPTTAGTYWAGAPAGGLWKTTNNGATWSTTTDFLNVIGCSDLAVDPTNTNTLYLATGDGDAGDSPSIGVLKSTDGGLTWNSTGLTAQPSNNFLIRRLLINPNNTQIVLAATNAGIYRTINGGTSWTQINTVNTYDMEFKPGDPTIVYATGAYFYLSTNSGATFTQITSGIATTGCNRMAVAVTTNSAGLNYVYVAASTSSASDLKGIYRSTNSGVTFSLMATTPNLLVNSCAATGSGGQGWYDLAIAASPLNPNEVVVGGVNHWRSTNGGSTWSIIGCWNSTGANPPYVHADVHDLEYTSAGVLYSASDGGISQYTGTSWTDVTGNRNIAQIYRIGISSTNGNLWITGHQDNGSNIYNGTTYNASFPGDGLDCFIDKANNNNLFTETPYGGLVKSTNGGVSWSSASSGITGSSNWLCPWKQSTGASNVIYAGFNALWRSNNQGTSWTSLAPFTTTAGSVVEFAIAPSNSLVIYALKSSAVYYTNNGGTSWTNVTGTIPVGSAALTYVAIDAANPARAWVTLSGYSTGNKVFMTINSGGSWTNVSSNLPNLPANCIVHEPGTNGRVYVGMDVGVYYKDVATTNWTLYNTGLPNTVIADLEISPALPGRLRAATYGRGVYQVDVVPCTNGPTVAVSNQTICAGSSATLTASGASVYAWNTGGTSASIVVSPTLSTVYTVTGSVGSCTDVKSATVFVNNNPTVNVAPTFSFCSGSSVTLTASGAANYTWTGISLTSTSNPVILLNPSAGIYTVIGKTGTCSNIKTFTLTSSALPTITAVASQSLICAGNCSTLYAAGASSYTWYPGAITGASAVVCPSTAVIYTVNGATGSCVGTKTVSVGLSAPPTLTVSANQTICAGSCATLVGSGTATSYTWLPSGTNGTTKVVCPTITTVYTVVASNGNCTTSKTVAVNVGSGLSVSINTLALCAGSTGTLVATGATNYTWSTGATGNSLVVAPITNSVYSVIGSNGVCTGTANRTVSVTAVPVVTINSVPGNTICSGSSVVLSALGGCTYTWNTGATTSSIVMSPTASSVYSVITNCSGCTGTKTIGITVLSAPSLSINPSTPTVCSGSSVTLSASGANQYTWSTNSTNTTIVVNPTSATVYTLTGSNGGCISTKTVNVGVSTVSLSNCGSSTVCAGSFAVMAACGATSYTYSSGSPTVNPLSSTNYTVVGTNALGCVGTVVITMSVLPVPTIAVVSSPTLTASSLTICSGASATLSASGASTYSWSSGGSGASTVVSPSVTTQYIVTGVNASGCSSAQTLTVVVAPSSLSLSVNALPSAYCQGGSSTITATGASSYTWSTGSTASVIVVSPSVTTNYSVTGSNGSCFGNSATTVSVNPLPVIVVADQTICPGGSATLVATGANTYTWSTGNTGSSLTVAPLTNTMYTVNGNVGGCVGSATVNVTVGSNLSINLSVSDPTICAGGSSTITATGATSYTWSTGSNASFIVVNPLTSTSYSVDGLNGVCSGTAITNITVVQTPTLVLNSSSSGTLCSGASATLSASGASTYSWSNGATGSAIVVTPSASAVYTVTGSNGGCVSTSTIALTVGAGSLNLAVSANPVSVCQGGSAFIFASGAGAYVWSNGATTPSISVTPSTTTTYTVNGTTGSCSGSAVITISVGTAPALNVSAGSSGSVCIGQSVVLSANGAYSNFVWSGTSLTGSVVSVTPTASTVYTVVASGGSSGCSSSGTVAVSISPNPVSTLSVTSSGCGSVCSGAVNVNSSGGSAPYSYSLTSTSCSAMPCANLCAGLYTLYTTNSNGCNSFNIFSISSSGNNLSSAFSTTNSSCGTCADGILSVVASGGVAPYNYTWTPNGGNAATAGSLLPGCYSVTIQDATGCSITVRSCVGIMTDIENLEVNEANLLVFPNPAQNMVTVQYEGATFSVSLYNGLGQLISTSKGSGRTEINTSLLARGVYVMEIKIGATGLRKKLLLD
ncbi:MAG: T9SS type A sorting domain-containing protein [Bacteroidia bacterium]|nr:T9SS type A sorting domain-containing protein [Bacteroidia bacterium]